MAYKKLKYWFDKQLAEQLAEKIQMVKPDFPAKAFITTVDSHLDGRELKARVELIADQLEQHLSGSYKEKINLLCKILGPENEAETGMFTNYYWIMPIARYVEKYGIAHFDSSMKAIAEITKRNTGEYAIRPFLDHYPEQTLAVMLKWSNDKNHHLRRLASEGLRPRLPWAPKLQRFIDDPLPILPILDNLKDDPSKYVQKSVANCINDIFKDNFQIAVQLIEAWAQQPAAARNWIIRHALRNLIKQRQEWALDIINKIGK